MPQFLRHFFFIKAMKKIILTILAFVYALALATAQEHYCQDKLNKDAVKLFEQAVSTYNTAPKECYSNLQKVVGIEPKFAEAYYVMGEIDYEYARKHFENMRSFDFSFSASKRAESNFLKAIECCPSVEDYASWFYLAEMYFYIKDFTKCKHYLDVFLKNNSSSYDELKKGRQYQKDIERYFNIINNPVPFAPKIIEHLCTEDDEFLPFLSPDGDYLFYTRRTNKYSSNSPTPIPIEDFCVSRHTISESGEEAYSDGIPMDYPFNDKRDKGGASITIDNMHIYISVCEQIRTGHTSYKNCDIYVSDFDPVANKWSLLKNLGPNINNPSTWEGQPSISADGKTLYFASAREGGYGGIDIYFSTQDSLGNWTKAKNMGSEINTPDDDKTPFIHPDGKTLYFSSNGRIGIGGFDIFYSRKLLNNHWSEPEDMGIPINTTDDDLGLMVSTNGEKMFFSSNKLNGKGGYDIYSAELYPKARPEKVLFVKGKVDKPTNTWLHPSTSVELQSMKTLKLTKGLLDPSTGRYAVAIGTLQDDDEFIMTIKTPRYFYSSKYIHTNSKKNSKVQKVDFELQPIEVGTTIKLENIYFQTNSATFDSISIISLDNFVEFLKLNPSLKIMLKGHTDNIGSDSDNMDLSVRRSKAVNDYLVAKNISQDRITYKGYGATRPISSNATLKGRAANRRTEFVVTVK